MRILVYKRTHNDAPGLNGCFGVYDCMGSVRDLDYEAVVGVGGLGEQARAHQIDGRVNWIGIGPFKHRKYKRGSLVTFSHFLNYGTHGPDFREAAPKLADRVYGSGIRILLHGMTQQEEAEAMGLLGPAFAAPPSPARLRFQSIRGAAGCGSGPFIPCRC